MASMTPRESTRFYLGPLNWRELVEINCVAGFKGGNGLIIHEVACVKTYDAAMSFIERTYKSTFINITATLRRYTRDDKAERNTTMWNVTSILEYEILLTKNP
jgi:hypothetical protein